VLDFGIPKKLVRLIKMCLNETCSKVRVGKLLSPTFPIQNDLKQGGAILPCVSILLSNMPSGKSKKMKLVWNRMGHISCWSVLMMLICWVTL
jgi:hypothetical protein